MTPPIIVLGMHRSGTSCLAGLLQEAGVWFGRVPRRSLHNGRGSREHEMIVRLNDEILADSGGRWDAPIPLIGYTKKQAKRRDALLAKMSKRANGRPWGFKDPRTLLALHFWPPGEYIGTFRHPYAVASSLRASRGIDLFDGLMLWLEYNRKLLKAHEDYPFPLVSFDATPEAYLASVQDAFDRLDLPPASKFFLDAMRHRRVPDVTLAEPYRTLYGELLACSA